MTQGIRRLLAYCGLAILTAAAFSRVVNCDLTSFDDPVFVAANPRVQSGLTLDSIAWAFRTHHPGYWHPLTWVSLQLDVSLFGPNQAWGFHLTNLVLHVINVLLVLTALDRLTGAFWRSTIVAALFAVHPLRVESVAWVTERKDVLSMFFGLLAIWAYAAYARRPAAGRFVLVALFLALGLMSKAMLVTLPCVFLLLDFWPLERLRVTTRPALALISPAGEAPRRVVLEKVPLMLLVLGSCAATLFTIESLYSLSGMPLGDRLRNATSAYLGYLEKTFWPIDLAVYYPFPRLGGPLWRSLLSLTVILGITLFAWRRAYLLVGWLWFLGTLVPVIGVFQGGVILEMADRFSYLPHIGLFIAVVWGSAELATRWQVPLLLKVAIPVTLLACLAVLTWRQVGYWKDPFTLWSHTLEVTKENALANRVIGVHYLGQHQLDTAEKYLRESLRLNPFEMAANLAYAQILASHGQIEEAMRHYRYVADSEAATAGERARAQYFLGMHLVQVDRSAEGRKYLRAYLREPMMTPEMDYCAGVALMELGDQAEAVLRWRKVLDFQPDYPEANYQYGRVLLMEGRTAEALEHLSRAAAGRQHAGLAIVHNLCGQAFARLERWPEAARSLEHALSLDRDLITARADLAYVLEHLGEREAAAKQYEEILKGVPDWPLQASAQALHLLNSSDPQQRDAARAFELATEACQASAFHNPKVMEALALAHAALGRLPDAIRVVQDALAMSPEPELTRRLQELLHRFQKLAS